MAVVLACGCGRTSDPQPSLFEKMAPGRTSIDFANSLSSTEELNTYVFRNFYNGGGVAIGDVNKDGLADVFFTGNQVSNRLYLNRGGFSFQDITIEAGLESSGIWSTGATMADVNGDGWLDIHVCKSGPPGGAKRHNELYINNGDNTFTEKAREYGIAVSGLSIHASFLDYDGDGDLDLYLLSNPIRSLDELRPQMGLRDIVDRDGGNKLFRNDLVVHDASGGSHVDSSGLPRFVDVTAEAGIYSSKIGFGLGVSVADVNRDGWPDIYVSNDFFERDYLYVNQRDGTFEDVLPQAMGEISLSSMGGDIADLNNDGYPEVFVSDMLPASHERLMSKTAFETWDDRTRAAAEGYHEQFTRNTLHLNRGPVQVPDGRPSPPPVYFSEIGRLAGVEASDWSWGGLLADFDHDGRRDLFVPNGIYKDLLDRDYISYISDPERLRSIMASAAEPLLEIVDGIPSTPVPNRMFSATSELRFADVSAAWGLGEPTFSSGAAYGDLDNDGDLDLVINNVNMGAFVYRNGTVDRHGDRAWLQVVLEGSWPNVFAVGAQLTAWSNRRQWYVEQQPVRGFQSTVDHTLHVSFGSELPAGRLDSLVIRWPDGVVDTLRELEVNQRLRIRHPDVSRASTSAPSGHGIVSEK